MKKIKPPTILNTSKKISKSIYKFSKHKNSNHRYASFDYCYGYFTSFKNKKLIASTENLEKSCLHLVAYLASWGMYRGSSFLLREKSVRHYIPLVKWISNCPKEYWEIDIDNYDENNITLLLKIYKQIVENLEIWTKSNRVLVTKIMLGVFGSVPAFDEYFTRTFKKYFKGNPAFSRFNRKSLEHLKIFYEYKENKNVIIKESNKHKVLDFSKGTITKLNYTQAKIIDMIGFGYSYKPKKNKIAQKSNN